MRTLKDEVHLQHKYQGYSTCFDSDNGILSTAPVGMISMYTAHPLHF